ncbi:MULTISPECIES: RHS repeat-associated core domain-containing protein, partial [Vibrio]
MSTKRSDFTSGIVYFGYRFYIPSLGRWLNRDPLQEQGGINLYAYVNGDPLGYVDLDGRLGVPISPVPVLPPQAFNPPELNKALRDAEVKADEEACKVAKDIDRISDVGGAIPNPYVKTSCTAINITSKLVQAGICK